MVHPPFPKYALNFNAATIPVFSFLLRFRAHQRINPSSQFYSDIKIRISPNPIFGRFFLRGRKLVSLDMPGGQIQSEYPGKFI